MKKFTSIIIFCIISTIAFSQDAKFEKGLKAFDSKQFMKSFKIMEPYANSGDKIAQFVVGFCYYNKELEIGLEKIAVGGSYDDDAFYNRIISTNETPLRDQEVLKVVKRFIDSPYDTIINVDKLN